MRNASFALVLAFALAGCTPQQPTGPTPPGNVTVNVNVNQTQGGNGSSPAPGTVGVATVKIGEFGETCPSGLVPAEAVPRQVRLGCTAHITCTPRDKDGKELPAENAPTLTRFGVISGSQYVTVSDSGVTIFNLDIFGKAEGTAWFQCVVGGVPSDPWDLTVVK